MIKPLNTHYSFENPASIYDEEALTALELAGRQGAKINEVIRDQNALRQETGDHLKSQDNTISQRMEDQDKAIAKMNNETMPAKVNAEVQRKIDSGEFDYAINMYAGDLEKRMDNLFEGMNEGSTSMDAEVIDIRTGFDGSVHGSAGTAVRAVGDIASDIRTRADGGFVCFHDSWEKLVNWSSDAPAPIPGCCTTSDGTLKWYYREDMSDNSGVAIPVKRSPGSRYIYLDFEFSKVKGVNTLRLYVASKTGITAGQYLQIDTLDAPVHYSRVLDTQAYNFDINYIWMVAGADENEGYENLWIRISNLMVYTNILKENGFKGHNIESHLMELKEGMDKTDVGTVLLGGVGFPMYHCWMGNANKNFDAVTEITDKGDFGYGGYFPEYDSAKKIRVEFDLVTESAETRFNIYICNDKTLNGKYFVWQDNIYGGGHFSLVLDPAYISVYHGFDLASLFVVAHTGGKEVTWYLNNFKVYQNGIEDAGGYSDIETNFISLFSGGNTGESTNENKTETAIKVSPGGNKYELQVDDNGNVVALPVIPKNIVFIGNSLLKGFGFGMAASAVDKDYFYLVNNAVTTLQSAPASARVPGSDWEQQTSLAGQTAWCNSFLSQYLNEDVGLVIVQIGDNVNTPERKAVLAEGSVNLLRFIRMKCPNARVAWVGVWYGPDNIPPIQEACNKTGCRFINILDLHTKENENAIGNTWTDMNGVENTITSTGVATHPSDDGMRAIANRILYQLGITDTETYYN